MKNFKAKIIDEDLDFIKKSCDTDSQKSMFRIDKKTLLTLINEQLKDVKTTDVSFRNKHLYDIFWDINTYEEYESYARGNKNAYSAASEYYCKPDKLNAAEDYNKIKDLCKVFIPYFLYISYNNDQNVPSGRRHLGYMNYWLNKELKEKKIRATDFIDVLNALLDNKFSAIDNYNKFKNIVYNIDDKIFEELDLLRKLQDYYNKIITESTDKDKCPEYGRNFTKLFEEGIRKYHETKNKKFYIELLRIWARYNIEANGTKKCNNLPEPPVIEKLNQKEKAASLSKTRELCKTYTNIRLDTPQHWNQEYQEVLKHLSAHEVYNKLNTASSDDNICAKYCANIIHSNEYNEDFKKLCPKLTSNIKKLSETLKDINSPDNRCTYLTYWAYEKIINIFDSNTRHVHDKSAINALNQAVFMVNSELSSKDKCLFSFTGNLSEWKDEKLLHDYFKNYEKISKCSTSTNGTDCKSYCDYLKHISELYSSHINKCCSCYSYPKRVCSELCPKYFKCDIGYYPSDLLYNIGCEVKEEKEEGEEEGKEEKEKSYETAEDVFRNLTVDLDVINRSHIEKPFHSAGILVS
ncbi:hypothetical protein PVMG_05292 [Plasmodium vivax Mauritania I]|uniref:Uncharacterized protein n=1 Tax=Plasmodium vivax Mauritania I TaxID=1035515 RepID=A0A0J9W0X1_PLAVI|nr:hypothetical protein PVMG_05292 [Plasmodium vivax Mauritania I]